MDIEGEAYNASQVVNSVTSAGEAASEFVALQVGDAVKWFTDGELLNTTIANWMANNLGDVIAGTLDLDEAFIDLAEYIGQTHISGFVVDSIANVTDAKLLIDEAFGFKGSYALDPQGNLLLDANGELIRLPSEHAGAMYEALTRMAIDFALNSSGWDGEQYLKAGITTITAVVVNEYAEEILGSFGFENVSGAGAAGAAAAATTLIAGLLNSSDYDTSDWVMLGVQTGLAGAVGYGSYAISQLSIFGSVAGPVGIVAGAILGLIGGELISSFIGGKKFYAGEFGDKGRLIDSVYQIQEIETGEVDGNGDPVTVQALVATNANGSTILMQSAANGVTYAVGNNGADIIVGTNVRDVMSGGGGSDYIEGGDGDETISGGSGNDHLIGNDGDDVIQGDAGDDIIFGDFGNDIILGGDGNDFIHAGGNDNEEVDSGELDDEGNPIFTTLMDSVSGGAGADTILGGGGQDVLQGDAGDDMIDGGYGDDLLDGGEGNDLLLGNLGNDQIDAGDGDDKAFGDEGNDQMVGGNGNDYLNGGAGVDVLEGGNGDDLLYGGGDDDFIQGDLGDDNIGGGSGDDTLLGGMDDDYLWGQDGDDILRGGYGGDFLKGDLGDDVLEGGNGSDVYIIEADDSGDLGNDVIVDAEGANDRIYIVGLNGANEANLGLTRDGDDLLISYNAATIATVTDYFVEADSVERIEFGTDQYIDLSAVSYDENTGVGSFASAVDANQTTLADIEGREDDIDANLQLQSQFWNNGFIQSLSEVAYEEALRDQFETEYYGGNDVTHTKRARGKFGGYYTVWKLNNDPYVFGTNEASRYEEFTHGVDNPFDYDEIVDNVTKVQTSWSYSRVSYTITDVWIGDEHLASYRERFIYGELDSINDVDPNEAVSILLNGQTTLSLASDRLTYGNVIENISMGRSAFTGSDLLVGNYVDNIIRGYSGDDALFGNGGDDTINGFEGDDWLFGGDGDDTLNGGADDDVIFGGNDGDTLAGGDGDDAIFGGSGNDYITGGDGADWIDAGDGADIIIGGNGDDIIYAGEGNDYAEGGQGLDVIYGQGGNDIIYGNEGIDWLYGESGNDTILGVHDADHLYGGTGIDTLSYALSTAGVTINLATSTASGGYAEGDTFHDFENIAGSDYGDSLTGDSERNVIYGGAGNDSIYGGSGWDYLYGGDGADTLDGGDDFDYALYKYSDAGVSVSLYAGTASGGYAQGDVLNNIEGLQGSAFDDTLIGDNDFNRIASRGGADTIDLMGGDDIAYGWASGSSINGGFGNDTLDYYLLGSSYSLNINMDLKEARDTGTNLFDTYDSVENIRGSQGNDIILGDNKNNYLYGFDGNDNIGGGEGNDKMYGNNGNDLLKGNNGNDKLYGESGNDVLYGGDGIDYIYGGNGRDYIYGEAGDDVINGDLGNDIIDGGEGVDLMRYHYSTDSLSIDLSNNVAVGGSIGVDFITNIEQLLSGQGDDIITGSNNSDIIDGYLGDDTINGLDGDDQLYGHEGEDVIYGDLGNDYISGGSSRDIMYGGEGNDVFDGGSGWDYLYGGDGADTLDGGDDFDYALYKYSDVGVSVSLYAGTASGGYAQGDVLVNIEGLQGSAFDDTLIGDNDFNRIVSRGGADTIDLMGGDDIAYGWASGSSIDGGTGIDKLDYYLLDSSHSLTIDMKAGTAQNVGSSVFDTFVNVQDINGSQGDDTILGDGNDNLLIADGGDDFIDGGAGQDRLYGESGNDIFAFSNLLHSVDGAQDVIEDFVQGSDLIDLTAFTFTSISDFTITQVSGDTIVDDNSSTFSFKLDGSYTLVDNDFIFS